MRSLNSSKSKYTLASGLSPECDMAGGVRSAIPSLPMPLPLVEAGCVDLQPVPMAPTTAATASARLNTRSPPRDGPLGREIASFSSGSCSQGNSCAGEPASVEPARPCGLAAVAEVRGHLHEVLPVPIDQVDVLAAPPVRGEGELAAVRRPGRVLVRQRVENQRRGEAVLGIDQVDVEARAGARGVRDPLARGGPGGIRVVLAAIGQALLVARLQILDVDLRRAAAVRHE